MHLKECNQFRECVWYLSLDFQRFLLKIQSPSKFNPGISNLWRGNSFKLLNKCVNSIESGDDVYNRVDMTDKEVDDFIEQMNNKQFEDVMGFFNSMPKLRHIVNVTNPKTNIQSEVVLEGLNSFLV